MSRSIVEIWACRPLDQDGWSELLDALLADFEAFIGEPVIRDSALELDSEDETFSLWLWSVERGTVLGSAWSAVLTGSFAGDAFYVACTLFLFHEQTKVRLVAQSGMSYLLFTLSIDSGCSPAWKNLGWQKDEWEEWESIEL